MLGSTPSLIAYLSLALWAVAAVVLAPSAKRYIVGPYSLPDSYRTAMFFMALLWFGGLGRLIFMPHAEDVRLSILAMSCALAVYLIVLARQGALK
jgi:hypothetical protein